MCVSCDRGGPQTGNSTGVVYRTSGHRDVCSRVASFTWRQSGLRGEVWATGKIKYFMLLDDYTSLHFLSLVDICASPRSSRRLQTPWKKSVATWGKFKFIVFKMLILHLEICVCLGNKYGFNVVFEIGSYKSINQCRWQDILHSDS